jgi:transposase
MEWVPHVSELEKAQARISELEEKLAIVLQQVDYLKRQLFGKKSEAGLDPNQRELGLELSEEGEEKEKDEAPPAAPKPPRSKGARRSTRAQRLPDNLPVREETIMPLNVQAEPEAWRQIGEEVSDQLEKEPGYFYLRRTIRPKFVKKDAAHEPPVVALAPRTLIPGGFYGASLVTEIVLDKYLDHLPLYRLEQRYLRQFGVHLPRQTMSDTLEQVAIRAEAVVWVMEQEVWKTGYVQMDETPIRCLDPEKPGGSFRGWLWTVAGPSGGDVIFRWEESRGHEVLMKWLPADFEGWVQRDGYSAYAAAARRLGAKIVWVGCWAHVRRKFYDAAVAGDRVAQWFLTQIGLLYAVEDQARERRLVPVLRQRERAVTSALVMARLKKACQLKLMSSRPKSLLGQATAYALGQWESLEVYLENGRVEIDNNGVENAIRPSAVGKKNWLFFGAPEAGGKSATFYSLLGSCLRRGINPRQYLCWLFERLPSATNQNVAELTPRAYAALIGSPATSARRTA